MTEERGLSDTAKCQGGVLEARVQKTAEPYSPCSGTAVWGSLCMGVGRPVPPVWTWEDRPTASIILVSLPGHNSALRSSADRLPSPPVWSSPQLSFGTWDADWSFLSSRAPLSEHSPSAHNQAGKTLWDLDSGEWALATSGNHRNHWQSIIGLFAAKILRPKSECWAPLQGRAGALRVL